MNQKQPWNWSTSSDTDLTDYQTRKTILHHSLSDLSITDRKWNQSCVTFVPVWTSDTKTLPLIPLRCRATHFKGQTARTFCFTQKYSEKLPNFFFAVPLSLSAKRYSKMCAVTFVFLQHKWERLMWSSWGGFIYICYIGVFHGFINSCCLGMLRKCKQTQMN